MSVKLAGDHPHARAAGPLVPPTNGAASPLVMLQVPSPLENATGIVCHPGVCRTSAIPGPVVAVGTDKR
jgi:hypothetical protein